MGSSINDPNFGARDFDPGRPMDSSQLNGPNFGAKDPSRDPYTQTRDTVYKAREAREEAKFQRQLNREMKRGKLSERTQKELVSRALNDFVSQVISEKRASSNAVNTSATQIQQVGAAAGVSTATTQSADVSMPDTPMGAKAIPYGIYTVDLCVNGQARKLQLVTYGGPYQE